MKLIVILTTLLALSSCVFNLGEGEKKDNKKGLGGFISSVSDLILSSAHAAEDCTSSKSPDSLLYAELYLISDPSKLGTENENDGLIRLCDVDIENDGAYYFESDLPSDAMVKIKVVDNRPSPEHNGKQIIASPEDDSFNIDLNKSLQTRLMEKSISEGGLNLQKLIDERANLIKKYDVELVKTLIEKVKTDPETQDGADLSTLFQSVDMFETKIEDFWDKCSDCTSFSHAPEEILNLTINVPLSEGEKCFLKIDWEFDWEDPANQQRIASNEAAALECSELFHAEWMSFEKNRTGFLTYITHSSYDDVFQTIASGAGNTQEELRSAYDDFHAKNPELVTDELQASQKDRVIQETFLTFGTPMPPSPDGGAPNIKDSLLLQIESVSIDLILSKSFFDYMDANEQSLKTSLGQTFVFDEALAAVDRFNAAETISKDSGIIAKDSTPITITFDNNRSVWKDQLVWLMLPHYKWTYNFGGDSL